MTMSAEWDEALDAEMAAMAELITALEALAVVIDDPMGEPYRGEIAEALDAVQLVVAALEDSPTIRAWALIGSLGRTPRRRSQLARTFAALHADDLNDLAHVVETCAAGREAITKALATTWGKWPPVRAALFAMLDALTAIEAAHAQVFTWTAATDSTPTQLSEIHRPKRSSYCTHNRRHLVAATQLDDPAPSRGFTLNAYGATCRRFSLSLEAHS